MSDKKEKDEKVETPEVESKEIKKEKKKGEKGLIVAIVILAILLGLALPMAILLVISIYNGAFLRSSSDIPAVIAEIDEDDAAADDIIIEGVRDRTVGIDLGSPIVLYNKWTVVHKIDDDTFYPLAKSYSYGWSVDFEDKTVDDFHVTSGLVKNLHDITVKSLIDAGFVEYYGDEIYGGGYINNETGLICVPDNGYSDAWYVSCAKDSWTYSKEEEDLARSLAKALRAKGWTGPAIVYSRLDNIRESSNPGYQNIYASISSGLGGAVGLFYRKNDNPEWVYVTAVQATPGCNMFDDEAKMAFAGSGLICYGEDDAEVEL